MDIREYKTYIIRISYLALYAGYLLSLPSDTQQVNTCISLSESPGKEDCQVKRKKICDEYLDAASMLPFTTHNFAEPHLIPEFLVPYGAR